MFNSLLTETTSTLTVATALICIGSALVLGLIIAFTAIYCDNISKGFAISLVLLPALVQVVITMVNGNLGTGVAVMGAFGLVRFRSFPGNSKSICCIFFAMAVGLAIGMGYIVFAAAFTLIVCIVYILLAKLPFAENAMDSRQKELKVIIPEDLDYTEIFDEIFSRYTSRAKLQRVKTINLGSMYELIYHIRLKKSSEEKQFIDEIRCRNGNLTIICGRQQISDEL